MRLALTPKIAWCLRLRVPSLFALRSCKSYVRLPGKKGESSENKSGHRQRNVFGAGGVGSVKSSNKPVLEALNMFASNMNGVIPPSLCLPRPGGHCIIRRYARAYAVKQRRASAAAAAATSAAATRPLVSSSAASTGATRDSTCDRKGGSDLKKSAKKKLGRKGRIGGQGAATAASWRGKLAAVQRRRAELEEAVRAEARLLVERRAEKEVIPPPPPPLTGSSA